jgi:hypothetical protein
MLNIVGSISIQSNYSVHLQLHNFILKSFNRSLLFFFDVSNAEVLDDLLHFGSEASLRHPGGANLRYHLLVGRPKLLVSEHVKILILLKLFGELLS